jgi:carboxymethylenebutenolidase
MGTMIELKSADGFEFSAYRAQPAGAPIGGLVVIQEIFGVNSHIQSVCEGYAADGFLAIAPALFDRLEPGVELDYSSEGVERARALKPQADTDRALADIDAAREAAAVAGPVCVIGYCWGGLLAWLSATRLSGLTAVVAYYGGGIGAVARETPHCPVQLHFGDNDHAVPMSDVEAVRQAHETGVEIHVYAGAGHGFNCDQRASYDADSSKRARARSLGFLRAALQTD